MIILMDGFYFLISTFGYNSYNLFHNDTIYKPLVVISNSLIKCEILKNIIFYDHVG